MLLSIQYFRKKKSGIPKVASRASKQTEKQERL